MNTYGSDSSRQNSFFRAQTAARDTRIAIIDPPLREFDISVNLSPEQHRQLSQLVHKKEDLFAVHPKSPSTTDMCEHAIETGDAAPTKERARRIPPKWEVEIERQLEQMVKNGVCRPSHSPWASNVVLIQKRDGSWRFAIDYRLLNGVTKKDAYNLPNIQSVLDKLGGSRCFSFMDIASAYWCVPVRSQDVEKTAFHTPRGQYEMIVMPFGLCNYQATFQRLMDNALEGVERAES